MCRDTVGPGAFANPGDRDWVRLRIFRFRHGRIPRLPERRHMIDVDPELQSVRHVWNRRQLRDCGKLFYYTPDVDRSPVPDAKSRFSEQAARRRDAGREAWV